MPSHRKRRATPGRAKIGPSRSGRPQGDDGDATWSESALGLTKPARRWQADAVSCGYDVMVACQLPKLNARVRFPLPAPSKPALRAWRTKHFDRRPEKATFGWFFRLSSNGLTLGRGTAPAFCTASRFNDFAAGWVKTRHVQLLKINILNIV